MKPVVGFNEEDPLAQREKTWEDRVHTKDFLGTSTVHLGALP